MNVAVTRAKRLVVVIGDSGTMAKDEFLNGMMSYFREHGTVRSAFDYESSGVRMQYGEPPTRP